jgi:hypothetical protein
MKNQIAKLLALGLVLWLATGTGCAAQSRWVKGATLYGGRSSDRGIFSDGVDTYTYQGGHVGLGLTFGRDLGAHFTLLSGLSLVHRWVSYAANGGAQLTFVASERTINAFELPLEMRFNLRKRDKRWSPFVQGGLHLSYISGGKGNLTFASGLVREGATASDFTAGPLGGVGAEFRLAKRTHLAVQATASTFSLIAPQYLFYPDSFWGVGVSLYYR